MVRYIIVSTSEEANIFDNAVENLMETMRKRGDIGYDKIKNEIPFYNEASAESDAAYAVDENGSIIGIVDWGVVWHKIGPQYENFGRLGTVIVHPEYRERGIGTELCRIGMDHMKGDDNKVYICTKPVTAGGFALDGKLGFSPPTEPTLDGPSNNHDWSTWYNGEIEQ